LDEFNESLDSQDRGEATVGTSVLKPVLTPDRQSRPVLADDAGVAVADMAENGTVAEPPNGWQPPLVAFGRDRTADFGVGVIAARADDAFATPTNVWGPRQDDITTADRSANLAGIVTETVSKERPAPFVPDVKALLDSFTASGEDIMQDVLMTVGVWSQPWYPNTCVRRPEVSTSGTVGARCTPNDVDGAMVNPAEPVDVHREGDAGIFIGCASTARPRAARAKSLLPQR
jgi:hypothetical protein